jgi:hypothetical protein
VRTPGPRHQLSLNQGFGFLIKNSIWEHTQTLLLEQSCQAKDFKKIKIYPLVDDRLDYNGKGFDK